MNLRSKEPGVAGIASFFDTRPRCTPCSSAHGQNDFLYLYSSAPQRAQCGISRIWVLQQYRRKGIATRILDCVRYEIYLCSGGDNGVGDNGGGDNGGGDCWLW